MSISKIHNLSYLIIYTIFISTDLFTQHFGISLISAHCTNAANKNLYLKRNFTRTYKINDEQMISTHVKKGQDIRISLTLNEPNMLKITLTKCAPDEISCRLFFNETVNFLKYLPKNSSDISIPCAPVGQYDLIFMSKINCNIQVNITLGNPFRHSQINKFIQSSRIHYQKRIPKRQLLLTWEKSKFDIHIMNYCIAINMQRNLNTLCEAVNVFIGQTPKLFCTHLRGISNYFIRPATDVMNIDSKRGTALACAGQKNKQLIQGLIPNKKYFVDVFGVHPNFEKFSFKVASTQINYIRPKPLKMVDGYMETGKITNFDRRATFVFRTPKVYPADMSSLRFMVIPCGTAVTAKIFNKRKLLISMKVYQPSMLLLNYTVPGERYLLKLMPMNHNDEMQRCNFRVAATMKDAFPTLPSNLAVEEIKSLSACTTSTITWNMPPDYRNIKYCVAVTKSKGKHFEESFTNPVECNIDLFSAKTNLNFKKCFRTSQSEGIGMQRYELTDLKPGSKYVVQVILKFGNNTLPYQSLTLFKSHICHSQENNKLPKINLSKKFPPTTKLEDNNILVP